MYNRSAYNAQSLAAIKAALAILVDPLLYKGVIDCAANPNYPAADAGHIYIVSVAGKIGGASGLAVTAGDMIVCNTDGTVAGTQAAVGSKWNIIQSNIDLSSIAITGGTIDGATIGGTTPAAGAFTSVNVTGLTASRGVVTDASKNLASDDAATGTGAPVRATSPTLVAPNLGTPASGTLSNCTAATDSARGVVELATNVETATGTSTTLVVTPNDIKYRLDATHENVIEDLSWLPPVTFTWDPAELVDGAGETSAAIAVPGAALGSTMVYCVAPYDLQGITLNAWVDAANSCKARLQNETGGTINLASGTWVMQARWI
jgi:hypothetical protein